MIANFRNFVRSNEQRVRDAVSNADNVYTPRHMKDQINLSADWMQQLKNSTETLNNYGDVDFASLNHNNTIPVVGRDTDKVITLADGGIFQGKIAMSEIDIKTNRNINEKIEGDLIALNEQMYYKIDDIVYGTDVKYVQKGMYGIISNPNVSHTASSLGNEYGNVAITAEEIIADMKLYINAYYDDINSNADQRPISLSTLPVQIKIPVTIMNVLKRKEFIDTTNGAVRTPVIKVLEDWIMTMGYNLKFIEDAGMELVSPQINSSPYKVMQIGVFTKNYMSLEIPFAPHRLNGGKDGGFHSTENGDFCAYTMKILGTQINRTEMFVTRDV